MLVRAMQCALLEIVFQKLRCCTRYITFFWAGYYTHTIRTNPNASIPFDDDDNSFLNVGGVSCHPHMMLPKKSRKGYHCFDGVF
jgi:hypothetical protein